MPTENEKSLEQTLKILNSDEQVSIPLLYSLSDLGPGELEQFCALWPRLNEERRRIVVRHRTYSPSVWKMGRPPCVWPL
jgi:hypothetical protein